MAAPAVAVAGVKDVAAAVGGGSVVAAAAAVTAGVKDVAAATVMVALRFILLDDDFLTPIFFMLQRDQYYQCALSKRCGMAVPQSLSLHYSFCSPSNEKEYDHSISNRLQLQE